MLMTFKRMIKVIHRMTKWTIIYKNGRCSDEPMGGLMKLEEKHELNTSLEGVALI